MHNIEHFTYAENVNQQKVQKSLDDYVAHQDWEEGCCGLYNAIRWIDRVFESYEEALRYIEHEDARRNYNCMAVKFKEYGTPKPSAKITKLEASVKDQREKLKTYIEDADPKKRTSEFIGCPKCGSSLKRELLRGHFCPLCAQDLRSETNRKKILGADQKLRDLERELQEEKRKQAKKNAPKTKWLVKIEYHT